MQRDFINIEYQIKFKAPFHFGTGLPRGLLDRSVCRDTNDCLYIPGSTLKGVFRQRCEQIARLVDLRAVSPHNEREAISGFCDNIDITDRIFGSRYKPGELYFDNAKMLMEDQKFFDVDSDSKKSPKRYLHLQTEVRTQTSVSRLLGIVREQALFQSEFGIKNLRFEGQVVGYLRGFRLEEENWSYSLLLLVAGICANDRVGANKSTGMGMYTCQIKKLKLNDETVAVEDLLTSLCELEYYEIVREDAE